MKPARQQILYKTSAASSVHSSGGVLNLAGIKPIDKSTIKSIRLVRSRSEVVQVRTLGKDSWTPAASTTYTVFIGDVNRRKEGRTESLKAYSYTTPSDLTLIGANAALQREYVHGKIITKINADATNYCVAATLGGGTGFTVTDDAGYYPVRQQGGSARKGANTVILGGDPDGGGWVEGTHSSTTTAAVYSFGLGDDLLDAAPIMDAMSGNIISGYYNAPLATDGTKAVSGQKYNAFLIESRVETNVGEITSKLGHNIQETVIYVDNGTGTSTTNLAGYIAFEKEMLKIVAEVYNDKNTSAEFFDTSLIWNATAGGAASGTDTVENKLLTDYSSWAQVIIGTSTAIIPTQTSEGINTDLDATDAEGFEIVPSTLSTSPKAFVVGKQEFSVIAKIKAATHAGSKVLIGFHEIGAVEANYDNYNDLAAIGHVGADIYTVGILANAATVATDTTVNGTDAAWGTYEVHVDMDGNVTAKYNGVSYPIYSVGTTALVLAADTVVVPFYRATNVGAGNPDDVLSYIVAVPSSNWIE